MSLIVIYYRLKQVKISYGNGQANGRVSVRIFYKRKNFIENSFYSSANTVCFPLPVAETFVFLTFTAPPA